MESVFKYRRGSSGNHRFFYPVDDIDKLRFKHFMCDDAAFRFEEYYEGKIQEIAFIHGCICHEIKEPK